MTWFLLPALLLGAWPGAVATPTSCPSPPGLHLELLCDASLVSDASYDPDCVLRVHLPGCRTPETPLGDLVVLLGAEPKDVTSLEVLGAEGSLQDLDLKDLPNLEVLGVRNGVLGLPKDLLLGAPGLRSFSFASNGATSIPGTFFAHTTLLQDVDLSGNALGGLPVDLLLELKDLKNLELQDNALKELRSELFAGVLRLEALNASNNLLESVQDSLFRGLKDMKVLSLGGNQLTKIPGRVFFGLTGLQNLDLSSNILEDIEVGSFEGLTSLQTLNLSSNLLQDLEVGSFEGLTSLQTLNLSSNLLQDIEVGSFDSFGELRSLDLGGNALASLPDRIFRRCRSLETLILRRNRLRELKATSFPRPRSALTYLDLGHNAIPYPTEGGFFPLASQTGLKTLLLNDNEFEAIPQDFKRLFVHLETVDLSSNLIEYVDLYSLIFQSDALELDLRNNAIRTVDLAGLWTVLYEKVVGLYLEGNDLLCNCYLYRFASLAQGRRLEEGDLFKMKVRDAERVTCLDRGEVLGLLEVDVESLTCEVSGGCLPCGCLWRPHDAMLVVDCSGMGLEAIPSLEAGGHAPRGYSVTLDASNNSISDLKGLLDPGYEELVNLTVPYNALSALNASVLPGSLRVLDVRSNNLTFLEEETLEYLNASDVALRLGLNPWKCDCEVLPFLAFLHVPSRKVDDFDDIRCQDEPLMTLSELSVCPFFLQPMVIATILAVLAFLLLFAVLGTVSFYRYKQGIKLWLFTHRLCLWAITEDEMDADKKYDAFISYSHKDEDFVNKVLVPGLESGDPKYRICLHYRDWIPGEYIQNQILQSVEASRRTIVVLSSNFIESVWGQLEFKAAHSQALQDRTNRIIIIVYGEIPPEKELDEKLQLHISMKTYVKWGDAKFWEKLRYVMPHSQDLIQKRRRKRRNTDKLELCKSDSKLSS